MIALGGGVPINVGDETIGAVGVSGTSGGQEGDDSCAKAAIARWPTNSSSGFKN